MILTVGDSHTAGTKASMEGKMDQTYPHLLSKLFNQPVVDLSVCGYANDTIVRKTLEYVCSDQPNPEKVVVQLTTPLRWEMIEGENYSRMSWSDGTLPERFNPKKWGIGNKEVWRKMSHATINQMYSLQCVFESHNIEDYTFLVFPGLDVNYNVHKWLNYDKCITGYKYLLLQKGLKTHEDGHFGPNGHIQLAEWIGSGYSYQHDVTDYTPIKYDYTNED